MISEVKKQTVTYNDRTVGKHYMVRMKNFAVGLLAVIIMI